MNKLDERKSFTGSTTPLPWPKCLWHERCWRATCLR